MHLVNQVLQARLDPKDLRELVETLENVVKLDNQELMVHLAKEAYLVLLAFRVSWDPRESLGLLGHQVQTERRAHLVKEDGMDFQETLDQLDLKESSAHKGNQASKVKKEGQERMVQMEPLVSVVKEDPKEHRAMQEHQVLLDFQVPQVLSETREIQVILAPLDHEEIREEMAKEVMLVLLGHLEHREKQDQEEPLDCLEHLVSLEMLVFLVPVDLKVPQALPERMEQMVQVAHPAHQGLWETKESRVLPETWVKLDQRVMWGLLDLKDHLEL